MALGSRKGHLDLELKMVENTFAGSTKRKERRKRLVFSGAPPGSEWCQPEQYGRQELS